MIAADWAVGFMQAIGLRPKAWDPLLMSKRGAALLCRILVLCDDVDHTPGLGLNAMAKPRIREDAADMPPSCVMAIAEFWRERRPRSDG